MHPMEPTVAKEIAAGSVLLFTIIMCTTMHSLKCEMHEITLSTVDSKKVDPSEMGPKV